MSIVLEQCKTQQLTTEQQQAIQQLLVDSYAQYEPYYTDPAVWTNYLKDINAALAHPHIEQLIVAKEEDSYIGSVALFKGSGNAYNRPELQIDSYIIRFLAVDPQARGKRIAQQLVEESLRWIAAQGGTELVLHTSNKMQSAIALYERMGFVRAEHYDYFVGDNHVKSYQLSLR